jgi:hypothetical protein
MGARVIKGLSAIAAALLIGSVTIVRAGPATPEVGAAGPAAEGQLPSLGSGNPLGIGGAGTSGSGPSFGGENPQGTGLASDPSQLPGDVDEPSSLSPGTSDKK